MATNLSTFAVHVDDPRGKKVVIKPGDDIPAWAKDQITNPYVLRGADPDAVPGADDDEDDDVNNGDGPPPRSGKGSGVRAWRTYAENNGVDADSLDVDEIVAKLDDAGVPVE